jgi:predicted nucleic acid-binding protein
LTRGDYQDASAIFRTCRRAGAGVGSMIDCLIAQTCVRNNYLLLSKDRDFRRIAACSSLRLVEFG